VDYVADLLAAPRLATAGYFDPVAVAKLVEKCRRGRAIGFADNMAFVTILSTMLLHEQFIGGSAGVPPAASALRAQVPVH
jgi:asparagine synthase (glutamine-hydrolysing)